jgi:predicted TIM-barrel fold metal-dependent hydrolase
MSITLSRVTAIIVNCRCPGAAGRELLVERRMITSDCHIAPPFSLIDELPESYREYFPRLEHLPDGTYLRNPVPPEAAATMLGASDGSVRLEEDDPRALARLAVRNVVDEARPSFDAAEQLSDLERDGTYGAVLIGRNIVFEPSTPPEVDAAYCRLANDWLAETWGPYLDRVAPGIHLPYNDVAACVQELERAAAFGLRPALLPDGIFARPYHLAEWEPLWEAANSLKIPLTMHIGGLRNSPNSAGALYPGGAEISWYMLCCAMGETLGWLTYSGVFDRYPDLHVVMTEGYAGWLAFAMQFFDHHWNESRFGTLGIGNLTAAPKIDKPPSFYLKRQAHATFMWDPVAIRNRDLTGIGCLLWGNDYPHLEGSFPFSSEWNDKQFAGVPEEDIDAMVRGNAARLFSIDI